jgi:hypothetical protein
VFACINSPGFGRVKEGDSWRGKVHFIFMPCRVGARAQLLLCMDKRYKVAAQRNSTRWYNATAKFFPSVLSGAVQIYDPISQKFVNYPEWTNPAVEMNGPFFYFLSTVNVDRLEPDFRITSLARTLPSKGATHDVVVVRPLRDPSLVGKGDAEARMHFAHKIWQAMGGAYADGVHVNLRYDEKGEVGSEGNGPLLVEYVRCGGWEWIPVGACVTSWSRTWLTGIAG